MSRGETTPPSLPEPARGSLRLLLDPVFGPFFGAKLLSATGVWIYNVVAAILVFDITKSALMVGLVSAVQFGPQLALALPAGAMADRGDRRRQLVAGKLVVAAASGGLAIWVGRVGVEGLPGTWPVMISAFLVGLGFVLVGTAQNALIPALVRSEELAPAIALNTVPPTLARAGGPAIGALVAATISPAFAFAIASASHVLFALIVLALDIQSRPSDGRGIDQRIRVGVQHLRSDRRMAPLLVGVAAIGVGADPAVTLTPSLSAGFDAGTQLVGLFASAFGMGALAAFVVLTPLRLRVGLPNLGPIGLLTLSAGMASTGLSPTPALAAASLAVAGVGMTVALTTLTTRLQEWVPDEIRGRIMALWMVAFLGSRPLAAALNGAVADATAPGTAFLLVAVIAALAAWRCRPSMLSRARGPHD